MGYDISNYEEIAPAYGTMEQMETLIQEVHRRGQKLIMDLVINHTSDQHAWFLESKESRDNPKSDWYIWRDPRYISDGTRQPPNNWGSVFGGCAWEYVASRDQYYLHIFTKDQPDLNWETTSTRKAIYASAIDFWMAKGIDGFRVDTANLYSKHQSFADEPIRNPNSPYQEPFEGSINGPRIHEFMKEFRKDILDKYGDVMTVGECAMSSHEETLRFVSAAERELSMLIDFDLVVLGGAMAPDKHNLTPHQLPELKSALSKIQELIFAGSGDAWGTVFAENHDQSRSINRFTPGSLPSHHSEAAKLLATMLATLTGTLFVYQGQEIGMTNVPSTWPESELRDISALNYLAEMKARYPGDAEIYQKGLEGLNAVGRDNARSPMQWTSESPYAGFTSADGKGPWMRVNDNYTTVNVETATKDPDSILAYWKMMLKLRKRYQDIFTFGKYVEFDHDDLSTFTYLKVAQTETTEADGAIACVVVLNFTAKEQVWDGWDLVKEHEVVRGREVRLLVSNLVGIYEGEKENRGFETLLQPWEARIYLVDT